MSTIEFNLDTFLSDVAVEQSDSIPGLDDEIPGISTGVSYVEPGYEGKIDYRIRQLSYSSLLTLHECPRKFQLYKLRTTHKLEESLKSKITFAFGHVVGEAIQNVLIGLSYEEVVWKMFLGWKPHLFATEEKDKKSFWDAVLAIKRFIAMRDGGLLNEYELVYYDGKPAVELSFCVVFPDGFRLRGFVDAVLRHRGTGEILVLECKTTKSSNLNAATYKNSSQAIGYSVVLDVLFAHLSSYKVLYLVYQTGSGEYTPIPFVKTYLQRAQWLQDILFDIETIKMYENAGVYPLRGESCFNFFRECEYINTCTMSTEFLTRPCTEEEEDKTEYQINLTLMDLLNTQLERTQPKENLT